MWESKAQVNTNAKTEFSRRKLMNLVPTMRKKRHSKWFCCTLTCDRYRIEQFYMNTHIHIYFTDKIILSMCNFLFFSLSLSPYPFWFLFVVGLFVIKSNSAFVDFVLCFKTNEINDAENSVGEQVQSTHTETEREKDTHTYSKNSIIGNKTILFNSAQFFEFSTRFKH